MSDHTGRTRTKIEDLSTVGEELSEEHLRLVAGGVRKNLLGTSTATDIYTVIWDRECRVDDDGDED